MREHERIVLGVVRHPGEVFIADAWRLRGLELRPLHTRGIEDPGVTECATRIHAPITTSADATIKKEDVVGGIVRKHRAVATRWLDSAGWGDLRPRVGRNIVLVQIREVR